MNGFINVKVNSNLVRICIFVIPIISTVLFNISKYSSYNLYGRIAMEDGFVEYMTAFSYFLSSILALLISIRFINNKYTFFGGSYFILACCLFIIFGEEISWGQRILNIETPESLRNINLSGEIHNIKQLDRTFQKGYVLVGFYGAFLWPTLYFKKLRRKYNSVINPYFIPNWYLMGYFAPVSLIYIYWFYIFRVNNFLRISAYEREPTELLLSLGFLIFLLINSQRQKQRLRCAQTNSLSSDVFQFPKS